MHNTKRIAAFTAIFMAFVLMFARGELGVGPDRSVKILRSRHFYRSVTVVDKSRSFVAFEGCDLFDAAKFEFTARTVYGKPIRVYTCDAWPFGGVSVTPITTRPNRKWYPN